MILTEKIEVKIHKGNLKHYIDKGYDVKLKDVVEIDIEDIVNFSTLKVIVKCDVCDEIKEIKYCNYYRNIRSYGFYSCCQTCTQVKTRLTNLKKYGDVNFNNKEKYIETCLKKYGVTNTSQTEEFKNKYKQTCLERYGVEHFSKTDIWKNEFKKTCLEKYGVENVSQNREIFERIQLSLYKRRKFKIQNCYIQVPTS